MQRAAGREFDYGRVRLKKKIKSLPRIRVVPAPNSDGFCKRPPTGRAGRKAGGRRARDGQPGEQAAGDQCGKRAGVRSGCALGDARGAAARARRRNTAGGVQTRPCVAGRPLRAGARNARRSR